MRTTAYHTPLTLRLLGVFILGATVLGAYLRLPDLDLRPMHCDEAVHADKFGVLYDTGEYLYNPLQYHGPTIYYFALPLVRLTGASTYAEIADSVPLRLVPVLFGILLIVMPLLIADGLGRRGAAVAALLTAVSPAMTFYSRYYIQEMLLVVFTFGAIVAVWRYTRSKRLVWALVAGASTGFMHATKETCVIAYGAFFGAAILTFAWTRWRDGHHLAIRPYLHHWHIAGALKAAVVISVLCLTAFLSNPRATVDSVMTYASYVGRARAATPDDAQTSIDSNELHHHPWHYYLKLLLFTKKGPGPWWSEGLILLLAAAGLVQALRRRRKAHEANVHLLRFIAFFTILMTVAYSIIPYKTPWCLLGFLHGMILLAGAGAAALARHVPSRLGRWFFWLVLLLGAAHLAAQSQRANYKFYADRRNPYVYAHTSTNFLKLADRINELAPYHPDGFDMLIKVISLEYWPLPYYLRRFNPDRIGYFGHGVPDDVDAPVIMVWPEWEDEVRQRARGEYVEALYGLRPDVLVSLWVEKGLWDRFMEDRR